MDEAESTEIQVEKPKEALPAKEDRLCVVRTVESIASEIAGKCLCLT